LSFLQLFRKIARKAKKAVEESDSKEVGTNPLGQRSMRMDMAVEQVVMEELKKLNCALLSEETGMKEFSRKPKHVFVVDPVDGSENYRRNIPIYALGICVAPYGGNVSDVTESYIYDLVRGEEFYAAKGRGCWRNGKRVKASGVKEIEESIVSLDFYDKVEAVPDSVKADLLKMTMDYRRFGPDLLDMAYVASGSLDGFIDVNGTLSVIHASGPAIMSETCVVTDESGQKIRAKLVDVKDSLSIVAAGTKELHAQLLKLVK